MTLHSDKLKKCNLALTKLFLENEGLKEAIFQNKSIDSQSEDGIHKENFIKRFFFKYLN